MGHFPDFICRIKPIAYARKRMLRVLTSFRQGTSLLLWVPERSAYVTRLTYRASTTRANALSKARLLRLIPRKSPMIRRPTRSANSGWLAGQPVST
jgi:hypothetical protein